MEHKHAHVFLRLWCASGSFRAEEGRKAPMEIAFPRGLNLEDFRAEPSEEQSAVWTSQVACEI